MEPTNVKVGEYVGVYHDSKEDSFYFNTIPVEEYDTVKQDASAKKNCCIECCPGTIGTHRLI